MKFYTVHEPLDAPADRHDRAESLVFVRDGFSWLAFLFGPLWLLAKGLWLATLGYLAVAAALAGIVAGLDLSLRWLSLIYTALNLILALEASSLLRWQLDRQGWKMLGTVSGRNIAESERRFLEGWLSGPRLSRADEFVDTVKKLREHGGGGLAAMAAAEGTGSGGRLTPEPKRGWMPWRSGR